MTLGRQTTSDLVRKTSLSYPPTPGSPGPEQRSPKLHISFIPLAYSNDDPEGSARRLVTALRPDWDEDKSSGNGGNAAAGDVPPIEFVRFTEGITNTLLKAVLLREGLSREDADRDAVLLRAYGHGSDLIIDRLRETQNHELLMRYGLAPELLARFHNGMMYRFISGTAAKPADLRRPHVYRAVARRLAEWHAVVPCIPGKTGHGRRTSRSHSSVSSPTTPSGTSLNASASSGPASMATTSTTTAARPTYPEPSLHRQTSGGSAVSTAATATAAANPLSAENAEFQRRIDRAAPGKPSPNVWTVMQKWIFALPTVTDLQRTRREELQLEFNKLVTELSQRPGLGSNALVFAHCDLLSGNVILPPKPSPTDAGEQHAPEEMTVSFIDYEYATPSPAAFDISNHFAEWGGFDCDWSALPTRAQRREFITEYIRAYFQHLRRSPAASPPHRAPAAAIDEAAEVDRLMAEVDKFRGLPGFYWGVWALIQADISEHDFDYAGYAETRLAEYWAWRDEESGRRVREGREAPVRESRWAQEEEEEEVRAP